MSEIRFCLIAIRPSKSFAVSAARMDAPAAAAIGDLMVVQATRAIGRIDITTMAIGPKWVSLALLAETPVNFICRNRCERADRAPGA